MRSINTDNGLDIILEILRQSQAIKDNMKSNESKTALGREEFMVNPYHNPRASLRSPDTDGDIMLSRKGQNIHQRNKDKSYNIIKSRIESILNSMTAQDYQRLSEEGVQVESLTFESLVFAVQLIKDYNYDTKASIERASDKKEAVTKKPKNISEKDIINRMDAENLPVSKESVERIKVALKLSDDIPQISRRDILFILRKELKPSVENLYKARYSKQNDINIKKLSDSEWNKLSTQVSEIVDKAGLKADNEVLEGARWLIENNIPLTEDNISLLIGLEELAKNYSKDKVFDSIIDGMKQGELPGDALLIDKERIAKKRLFNSITARRQLEEIRLQMTKEAVQRLGNKGFDIDTEALEKIVEKLRIAEGIYYKELFNQYEMEPDEASIRLLHMTKETVDELKTMPVQVLGMTLSDRRIQTVSGLLEAGRSIFTKLEKAKKSYEALFTKPNAEYGDSIKKAFANMGSLMEEMGIEDTSFNQRAIRILGYNNMEITKESIEQVKAYDLSVNYLLENLNPEITLQIIRDGMNPMELPIDQLNSHIDRLKNQGYSSLEKYSSFLYKLEKEDDISESERKAYIGIYRLLYQIEKSDGAALGALIKAEQEVTLSHLLTALRTNKKGEMNYAIDDEFGVLQEAIAIKESITDQLGVVFKNDPIILDNSGQMTQNEIQNAIIKELLESLTPNKLHQLYSEHGWETIANMSTEKLLDQLKNMQNYPSEDQAYYNEKFKELQNILSKSDQAIRFLNDFQLPCTTANLVMAGHILNNSGAGFKKLFGILEEKNKKKDESTEKLRNRLKKKTELVDTLIDKETMAEAYEQLDQEVKAAIEEEAADKQMDFNRLTQLKTIGMQMHFLKNLAKREFYHIPLETSGKITNVNLTIIRGKSAGGKVTVTLLSDKLGSIRAEASIKDRILKGYISSDYIESLKILEAQTDKLKADLSDEGIGINQMNFCLHQARDIGYTYQDLNDPEEIKGPETERLLYRVAKAFINMIRSAEESDIAVA